MISRMHGAAPPPQTMAAQGTAAPQGTSAQLAPTPVAQRQIGAAPPNRKLAPPSGPLVGPDTTVLHTAFSHDATHRAHIASTLVLGHAKPLGDPRLGPAQVGNDMGIKLSLSNPKLSPDQVQQGQAKARDAVRAILDNTERAYQVQGGPGGWAIQCARQWLGDPNNQLTAGAYAGMMRSVSEAVHTHHTQGLEPSRAQRQTGRMPMDCMTHLAYASRRAAPSATPEQRQFLGQLDAQIRGRAMRHDLGFDSTRQFLGSVKADCERLGLTEHAALAGQLGAAIPPHGSERAHATALHDNVYGRALESVLVNELVRNPPDSVKSSMTALSAHLDRTLSAMPLDAQHKAAADVQAWMNHEYRGWQGQAPALQAFATAPPSQQLAALRQLLQSPKHSGEDCIAVPYVTVKLSVCMGAGAPWMAKANDNYANVVGHAAARETETAPNPNRIAPKSGITAHHQPVTVATHPMQAAMHPGDRNRPALHAPSPELLTALEHGAPFVSGVSGSTNIVMHAVEAMRAHGAHGANTDAKDALLGTMMFLTHDGGHSMHEAMWVGNQLDQSLHLGMAMPGGVAANYVADYDQFLGSFPPEKGAATLQAASDTAWQVTLNQFGNTSHFSPDNPPRP